MSPLIRALLFRLEPELAHSLTLRVIHLVGKLPLFAEFLRAVYRNAPNPVNVVGLTFSNPVGLAAGYDKDALGWYGLSCLGFGHIEIGTVTPKPQPGNPKPRIFRLLEDRALINRMGFPGEGAHVVAKRLTGRRPKGLILGVNLGKNKDTPLENAVQDYLELFRIFSTLADYLTINVSSPNTVGLRRLQARDQLSSLLASIAFERSNQVKQGGRMIPILVKLSPDLSDNELDDALTGIFDTGMDGVIATNTTLNREGLRSVVAQESGGLSGAPLTARSYAMVTKIIQRTGNRLPVIGVGGIMTPADARAMLDAGASLVQIYTGMIYAGPGFVQKIIKALP